MPTFRFEVAVEAVSTITVEIEADTIEKAQAIATDRNFIDKQDFGFTNDNIESVYLPDDEEYEEVSSPRP